MNCLNVDAYISLQLREQIGVTRRVGGFQFSVLRNWDGVPALGLLPLGVRRSLASACDWARYAGVMAPQLGYAKPYGQRKALQAAKQESSEKNQLSRARNREVGRLQFAAVSRRLLSFLLLIAFLCQSLPVLSSQGVAERSQEIDHVTLHWQDTGHHHHEDQSLHIEDSADAAHHEHADAGFNTACPVTAGWGEIGVLLPISPDVSVQVLGLALFLDGPLRPPKAAA